MRPKRDEYLEALKADIDRELAELEEAARRAAAWYRDWKRRRGRA